MLNTEQSNQINQSLTRIFALPITRSTYREIQNAIYRATSGSREKTQFLLDMLFKSEPVQDSQVLNEIVQAFGVKTKLARDVMERGDFISLVTSDITQSGDKKFLVNRLRRIDGDEYQFLTDSESTLHLVEHFLGRVEEINNQDKEFAKRYKNRLKQLQDALTKLINT